MMIEIKKFLCVPRYYFDDGCFSVPRLERKRRMDYMVEQTYEIEIATISKRRGFSNRKKTRVSIPRGRTKEAFPQAPLVTPDIHRDLGQRF